MKGFALSAGGFFKRQIAKMFINYLSWKIQNCEGPTLSWSISDRFRLFLQLVSGAKVPVLKIKDKENSFEADINCECERNIRHTFLLRCYAQLDPRVQPLGLVIKLWAKNAGIINQRDHKLSGMHNPIYIYIYMYIRESLTTPVS